MDLLASLRPTGAANYYGTGPSSVSSSETQARNDVGPETIPNSQSIDRPNSPAPITGDAEELNAVISSLVTKKGTLLLDESQRLCEMLSDLAFPVSPRVSNGGDNPSPVHVARSQLYFELLLNFEALIRRYREFMGPLHVAPPDQGRAGYDEEGNIPDRCRKDSDPFRIELDNSAPPRGLYEKRGVIW
ncbi:hypothetical protein BJ085DRAFT_35914 [Dimargaris cristalligena]|uniref:Uncharacterized protein n=1 Tax=Dimargaris cristalligena TaxID=215637 RepID=A0A4Q0A1M0_9FUNG|nr:hypothetical protein BJ085DRAFT_35914 [Dimargaris cristalligena]|eukprot:RKP39050.1 hypothetical protein BJ085DRAFT_35914 [Dimargaris cristalligena]